MPGDANAPTKEQIWQTIQSTQPYLRAQQEHDGRRNMDVGIQMIRVAHYQKCKCEQCTEEANEILKEIEEYVQRIQKKKSTEQADLIYAQHAHDWNAHYKSISEDAGNK